MNDMARLPEPALSIGVDLGGTQVRAALVDASGRLLARAAEKTDKTGGPQAVVQQILKLIAQVSAGADMAVIPAIGISAPGPLDSLAGVILDIPTLPGWINVPIRDWVSQALGKPVSLTNDGVAAAIGEWKFGAGRGYSDFVYVTVSTGIGGGVISDGRVLHGRRQLAGHIGHMTILPDGEFCTCGNQGCWEAQASGTALGKYAREQAKRSPASLLSRWGDAVGAKEVFEAALAGDQLSIDIVARQARLLGIGIVNLLHLYSPESVVVGGGVSHGFEQLELGMQGYVREHALPAFREVPIVRAQLGTDSGLIGAAAIGVRWVENV
ncbi:MAG: hypothetical protein RJA34_1194 [Pseudomonadota bacterium]|jgi:glucokinase